MFALRIISNVLNPLKIFEVIFEFQELQSAVWNTCYLLAQVCLMDKGMGEDIPLTYRSKYWLRYGYLGTLNACDQWPISGFNITKLSVLRVYHRICEAIANNLSGHIRYLPVWNWAPLGKMINFRSFAQRNGLDQWSNNPSSNRADQWSDKTLSRVDLINHWSENGFARKERHRSEILIQITPKERTISLKTLFLFLSFQWHWLSWRTRLWGSRRGDGFLRLTVEILTILRLTLHFLPLWLD